MDPPPPEGSQEGTAYHSLVDELRGEPSGECPNRDAGLAKPRKRPFRGGGEGTGRRRGAADFAALGSPSHAAWALAPGPLFSFPDMIPTVVSVMGGDFARELWAESEQEAAAEESHGGAGAAGPIDDENQKGGGGDGEEPPQQQQQDEALGASEGPQPQGKQQRSHLSTFTGLQLKELESVFQRSQYPDVFER